MLTLTMDTSYKYLILGIYEDGQLLAGCALEAFKKQSETIFVELERLLQECGKKLKDVDRVVITKGPGSYTGLRIAMTIAKMIGTQTDAEVDVISTMQLYAGMEPAANVILDARGKRAYCAHVEKGQIEWIGILPLEEVPAFLQAHPGVLIGDGYLIGQEAMTPDFLANFAAVEPLYEKVDNVHALVPEYLKESDAYKV